MKVRWEALARRFGRRLAARIFACLLVLGAIAASHQGRAELSSNPVIEAAVKMFGSTVRTAGKEGITIPGEFPLGPTGVTLGQINVSIPDPQSVQVKAQSRLAGAPLCELRLRFESSKMEIGCGFDFAAVRGDLSGEFKYDFSDWEIKGDGSLLGGVADVDLLINKQGISLSGHIEQPGITISLDGRYDANKKSFSISGQGKVLNIIDISAAIDSSGVRLSANGNFGPIAKVSLEGAYIAKTRAWYLRGKGDIGKIGGFSIGHLDFSVGTSGFTGEFSYLGFGLSVGPVAKLSDLPGAVLKAVLDVVNPIKQLENLAKLGKAAAKEAIKAAEKAYEGAKTAWNAAKSAVSSVVNWAQGVFSSVADALSSIGKWVECKFRPGKCRKKRREQEARRAEAQAAIEQKHAEEARAEADRVAAEQALEEAKRQMQFAQIEAEMRVVTMNMLRKHGAKAFRECAEDKGPVAFAAGMELIAKGLHRDVSDYERKKRKMDICKKYWSHIPGPVREKYETELDLSIARKYGLEQIRACSVGKSNKAYTTFAFHLFHPYYGLAGNSAAFPNAVKGRCQNALRHAPPEMLAEEKHQHIVLNSAVLQNLLKPRERVSLFGRISNVIRQVQPAQTSTPRPFIRVIPR